MDPTTLLPTVETGAAAATPEPGNGELGEDAFLQLLTVQLQNQDPSNPVSNEDFIAQLAQFSSLEQLVAIQGSLDMVYLGVASVNNATMSSLLGTNVVARGDQIHLPEDGDLTLHFDATAPATSGTATITDEDGSVIATVDLGSVAEGEGTVVWDGKDADGERVPAGDYTVSFTGLAGDGSTVSIDALMVGLVDSVDYSTGVPRPSVGGVDVGVDAIVRVETP